MAALNADDSDKTLTLDLSFPGKRKEILVTDGATERAVIESEIKGGKAAITIKPHGGFVAIFK